MMRFNIIGSMFLASLLVCSAVARDIFLEFKGAYFLPTHTPFKDIYKGCALFGPELTVQLCPDNYWYAFGSFDYFHKNGHSVGLCDRTSVRMIPIAFGAKYIRSYCHEDLDFYGALGFQAVNVRTKNCSEFVIAKQSQWGFGGVARVGAYYHLPCDYLLDFFVGYSFAKVGKNACDCLTSPVVVSSKVNVSGAIFGLGLGYCF